jgi:hypothetical protein
MVAAHRSLDEFVFVPFVDGIDENKPQLLLRSVVEEYERPSQEFYFIRYERSVEVMTHFSCTRKLLD